MLLKRFHWSGERDRGDELVNALLRGIYTPVFEYTYITGGRRAVLELIDKLLTWKLEKKVRKRLLYLKHLLPIIRFVDRKDGWIMVMAGDRVVGWIKKETNYVDK